MTFFYDIEVIPNRLVFAFTEMLTKKKYKYIVYKDRHLDINDIPILCDFLNHPDVTVIIGFNNHTYDDLILQWILLNRPALRDTLTALKKVKEVSDMLIDDFLYFDFIKKLRGSFYRHPFSFMSIDLQKLHHLDASRVSLKKIMIILKMPNVLEFEPDFATMDDYKEVKYLCNTFETEEMVTLQMYEGEELITKFNKYPWFKKPVLERDIDKLDFYCDHDVEALFVLYERSKSELELRIKMTELFGVKLESVISLSRSSAADSILALFYSSYSKLQEREFKYNKTINEPFYLAEVIDPKIKFRSTELNKLLDTIRHTLFGEESELKFVVAFDNVVYKIMSGGLHSKDDAKLFRSTKDFYYGDADVSSYYPVIIENLLICPKHLDINAFIPMIKYVKSRRLESKKKYKETRRKDFKTEAEGFKIVINAIFGKLKEIAGWLYDIKAFIKVTINGQLYLLSLIEDLYYESISAISANTDGVVCKIPYSKIQTYNRVCTDWMKKYNFELEFTKYDTYARTNVNSYIAIVDKTKFDQDGNIKTKGLFLKELELEKGYNMPIVAIALYNYIVFDKPIEETIYEAEDILDFCISVNSNKAFNMIFVDMITKKETLYPRTNRYFVATKGGVLYKRYKTPLVKQLKNGKTTVVTQIAAIANVVQIINKVDSRNPKDYDVDYRFYIRSANETLTEVKTEQMKLNLF